MLEPVIWWDYVSYFLDPYDFPERRHQGSATNRDLDSLPLVNEFKFKSQNLVTDDVAAHVCSKLAGTTSPTRTYVANKREVKQYLVREEKPHWTS